MNLSDPLTSHYRLTTVQKSALKRLRINTVRELLYHFPQRYESEGTREMALVANVGQEVTLYGKFIKLETKKSWKRRVPISEGYFEDGSGRMKCMWFHQPYIAKMITIGAPVKVSGKITGTAEKRYLANPKVERIDAIPTNANSLTEFIEEQPSAIESSLIPVYAESAGITSLWFYHAIRRVFESGLLDTLEDPLPNTLRDTYHLPDIATSLILIHTPKKERDAEAARKRFAFEEVLTVQLVAMKRRKEREAHGAIPVTIDKKDIDDFIARFGFTFTDAQQRAIETIVADMKAPLPMSRLLEGDVGSGKTAVAATVSYAAIVSRDQTRKHLYTQVAYMAPTEVLAKQLFENFTQYFKHTNVKIGLLTSGTILRFPSKINPNEPTPTSRTQLLKWVASGDVQILIGTHALIQKTVAYKNLALVIIDEQHRFGTRQRLTLARNKNEREPHLLSMTATPIPRTLSLTIYGDLDLTLLDSMPPGRKPVITAVVTPQDRTVVYEKIENELRAGRQAYVICPRIDAPDPTSEFAMQAESVQETVQKLRSGPFKHRHIAPLHSNMTTKEKDAIMADFAAHKTDILVATSVIEVGVNVPNATIIMIEGAERFGLAQLHQLRGRVIRSTNQAYCYLVSESKSQKTKDRLKAITTAKNGFELAEKDLELRGSGELYGGKQWGISDLGMEAIKNVKMVEAARLEAKRIIETDPDLKHLPALKRRSEQRDEMLHFE